jgi:hypothetical protein
MASVPPTGRPGRAARPPSRSTGDNGLALAALLCGLSSVVLIFVPPVAFIGILLSLVAIGLGIAGLRTAGRLQGAGRGMAIAGIVAGAISVLIVVLGAFLLIGDDRGQSLAGGWPREPTLTGPRG